MDAPFEEIAKASQRLLIAMENYVDNMPSIREKLLATEKRTSIEDGLNYTDEEIENNVERQLDTHTFSNNLREAWKPFEGDA